eukprot:gene14770-17452_t
MQRKESFDKYVESWKSDTPKDYVEIYNHFQETTQFTVRFCLDVVDMAIGQGPVTCPLKCLDVACGSGALTIPLAERVLQVAGSSVTGIDFSSTMVQTLKKMVAEKSLDIDVHEMDGMNLTLPSNHYDHIFSISGLNFFPDRQKGLKEMQRVLKPGGTAYVLAWDKDTLSANVSRLAFSRVAPEVEFPEGLGNQLTFGEPEQFIKAFIAAGFSSARVQIIEKTFSFKIEDMVQFFTMNPMTVAIGKVIADRYEAYEREYKALLRAHGGIVTMKAHVGVGTK